MRYLQFLYHRKMHKINWQTYKFDIQSRGWGLLTKLCMNASALCGPRWKHTSVSVRCQTIAWNRTFWHLCIIPTGRSAQVNYDKNANFHNIVFTRDSCTGSYCWERVLAIWEFCPSVCLSVTTRYGFKARWDRDCGSSPYDSLESLVSYEVICATGWRDSLMLSGVSWALAQISCSRNYKNATYASLPLSRRFVVTSSGRVTVMSMMFCV